MCIGGENESRRSGGWAETRGAQTQHNANIYRHAHSSTSVTFVVCVGYFFSIYMLIFVYYYFIIFVRVGSRGGSFLFLSCLTVSIMVLMPFVYSFLPFI